jgi:hypothetical protein
MSIIDTFIEKCEQKPTWALASALSILYAIAFVLVSRGIIKNDLLFGFCVWGSPNNSYERGWMLAFSSQLAYSCLYH